MENRPVSGQRSPIPFVLTAYGLPHVMGYLKTKAGESHPDPLGPIGLMDAAVELGLAGVEMPLSTRIPSFEGQYVETAPPTADLRDALEARGLRIVADYGALLDHDPQHLRDYLQTAARVGATVVRATLSHLLCGDRRPMHGGWQTHLQAVAGRLREILPVAADLGICIAVENHQDATTDDLLRLAEMTGHHPAFGITLDTGNPLAVGEEPVEAARRLAPIIRHLHLKDYTIHFAPQGYRLVRCAAGDGVIDFPAILQIVADNGQELLPGIEIAAQATRTIPLLEPDWWDGYPLRPAKALAAALRILWERGLPAHAPYASAWERGADSRTVSAQEWEQVRRSVAYFHSLAR
jgi:sugar phosphate isomerase/epimerase